MYEYLNEANTLPFLARFVPNCGVVLVCISQIIFAERHHATSYFVEQVSMIGPVHCFEY